MNQRNASDAEPNEGALNDGTPDAGPTDGEEPTVSVVVVTYNEAERIRSCLDSVFELCREVPSAEVVLVDSNSSDETVSIAAEYPVSIYRLPADVPKTPSAGRYVGTHVARGAHLLFVDGDMNLHTGWLRRAIGIVRERPDVAGVDGILNENPGQSEVETVGAIRGVALYDAQKLDAVGGFDPFLQSLEDIDVGFQLSEAGYRLCRLPVVVADHPIATGAGEPLRRLQNGYVRGTGQAVRKSMDSPRRFVKHIVRLKNKLFIGAWIGIGAFSLLSPVLALVWTLASCAAFLALVLNRGTDDAIHTALGQTLTLFGIAWGMTDSPRPPSEYPLERVETVQLADEIDRVREPDQ